MAAHSFPKIGIGRFAQGSGAPFAGLVVDGTAYPLPEAAGGDTVTLFEQWDSQWPALQRRIDVITAGGREEGIDLADLTVLAPLLPRQIVCAGANYRRHVVDIMADHEAGSSPGLSAEERRRNAERMMDHRASVGTPFAFIKPLSCVAGPFDALVVPDDSAQTDWELELAVVIGKPARRVPREHAMAHVAGYTIANDITARDHIGRPDVPGLGLDFVTGKSCPGFLPLGPLIVPAPLVSDPQRLQLTLRLNDEVMQDESTADMIFPIARLIEFASTHMTLLPGDVICTGSPAGNGTHYKRFLRDGDIMRGAIEGLGEQRVPCLGETLREGASRHTGFVPLS